VWFQVVIREGGMGTNSKPYAPGNKEERPVQFEDVARMS